MNILFVRHATMIIEANSKRILVDPVFSDVGEMPPSPNLVCQSKNPLIRLETPIEELVNVDAAIITHLHRDHFDTPAIEKLPKTLKIFCQPGDGNTIIGSGFQNVTEVDKFISWDGLNIYRVNARHGEGEVLEKMGKTSGFIIEDKTKYRLYICGDSIWCEDVECAIKKFNPNAVVVNAGAATLPIGRPITMNESDMENVISAAPQAKIIAVHMEAWNHCMLTREGLKSYLSSKKLENRVVMPFENTRVEL